MGGIYYALKWNQSAAIWRSYFSAETIHSYYRNFGKYKSKKTARYQLYYSMINIKDLSYFLPIRREMLILLPTWDKILTYTKNVQILCRELHIALNKKLKTKHFFMVACVYFLHRDVHAFSMRSKTWLSTKGKEILARSSGTNLWSQHLGGEGSRKLQIRCQPGIYSPAWAIQWGPVSKTIIED